MPFCQNNPEKSYTEKKAKHIPSGYAWCTTCSFDATKNKRNFYRGEHCIERFCKNIRELAVEINCEEKEMILLNDKENKSHEKQKICHICKKSFVLMKMRKMNLNYNAKSEIIVITTENLEELLIVFAI